MGRSSRARPPEVSRCPAPLVRVSTGASRSASRWPSRGARARSAPPDPERRQIVSRAAAAAPPGSRRGRCRATGRRARLATRGSGVARTHTQPRRPRSTPVPTARTPGRRRRCRQNGRGRSPGTLHSERGRATSRRGPQHYRARRVGSGASRRDAQRAACSRQEEWQRPRPFAAPRSLVAASGPRSCCHHTRSQAEVVERRAWRLLDMGARREQAGEWSAGVREGWGCAHQWRPSPICVQA
eukprot:scaffold39428_cov72-Phaeocystis_antarctica.AAC.2